MTNDFSKVNRIPEFKKDLKKLLKKYSTLEEDINNLINSSIKLFHFLNLDNKGIFEITDLNLSHHKFYKVKKFTSRSFKGKGANSGLRLIYRYDQELKVLDLIEIYYKENKENEDRARISRNFNK